MRGKQHLYRAEERTITWPHCKSSPCALCEPSLVVMVLTIALKWLPQHSGSPCGPITPSLNGLICLPSFVNINIVILYQYQDVKTFGKPELMDSKIHKVSIPYWILSHPYVLESILNFKHIQLYSFDFVWFKLKHLPIKSHCWWQPAFKSIWEQVSEKSCT